MNKKKTVGLALGSGAARGYAHIGVLKVLERYKIKIDYIAGTSAGALIGALYGSGVPIKLLEQMVISLDTKSWFDITVPRMGLVKGNKLHSMVNLLCRNKDITDMNVKYCAVATDLKSGKGVYIKEGNIADAVRASVSIPGVFIPYEINEKLLVDGAVVDRVPVEAVKDMGADIVIGVDLGFGFATSNISSIFDVMLQTIDIMSRIIHNEKMSKADILIQPDLEDASLSDFGTGESTIKRGEEATEACIKDIMALLEEGRN
jgi:NTE family protein